MCLDSSMIFAFLFFLVLIAAVPVLIIVAFLAIFGRSGPKSAGFPDITGKNWN